MPGHLVALAQLQVPSVGVRRQITLVILVYRKST